MEQGLGNSPGPRTRAGPTPRSKSAPKWRECQGIDPARGFGKVLLLGVGVLRDGESAPKWRERQGIDPARRPGKVPLLGVGVFQNEESVKDSTRSADSVWSYLSE